MIRTAKSILLSSLLLLLVVTAAPAAADESDALQWIDRAVAEWLEGLAEEAGAGAKLATPSPNRLSTKALGDYTCLPTCGTTDGKFLTIAGIDLATLAGDEILLRLAVPAGEIGFEVGVFDGDTSGVWDLEPVSTAPGVPLEYTLIADPDGDGMGPVVATWDGSTMPDNAWIDFPVVTDASAQAPSGAYLYALRVRSTNFALPNNWSNFKIRTSGVLTTSVSVSPVAIAFTGPLFGAAEGNILYPNAGSGDFTTTTYDGSWSFFLDVFETPGEIELWDGDFDRGTVNAPATYDTDDPDTPNAPFLPPWADPLAARPEGVAFVLACATEASQTGCPADDRLAAIFVRSPSVEYSLIAPDGATYPNPNPSGNMEWEHFSVSTAPFDPSAMDHSATSLPPGIYEVRAQGIDLSNLNAWRFFHSLVGVCENDLPCLSIPRPYLVGDTVFYDHDGDGVQDPEDPGIEGVALNLVDAQGVVIGTTTTDATGTYQFGVESGTWSVVVDASNFEGGGALEATTSTTGGESITDTVVDDNVWTYDFGYRATGAIGDRVWHDQDADGVQDGGEPGLNGVTVTLTDGAGNTIGSQVTSGDGGYLFENLPAGDYTVTVDDSTLPAGYEQTYDLDGLGTPHEASLTLGPGEENLDVDFGYEAPAPACQPCDGKVTELTLRYNGASTSHVTVKGRRGPTTDTLFEGTVAPGETFEIVGPSSGNGGFSGTVGTEIKIYVDGSFHTTIHTSCSVPIGPGLVSGDFEVVAGESKNGGTLCPVDDGGGSECQPCEGKVTELTLRYDGGGSRYVKVVAKKGNSYDYVFSGWVSPGDEIEIDGPNGGAFGGTLGTEIRIYYKDSGHHYKTGGGSSDYDLHTTIHTSCSEPIGPGLVSGDFVVVEGESQNGGELCPVDGGGSCSTCNDCPPALDFDQDAAGSSLGKGTIVTEQWAAHGVHVTTKDPSRHPAMIFDSSRPTGGDHDLGTPNDSFGGPGMGTGGKSGMPGENRHALGNVLILSEDGKTWNPDDDDSGGTFVFTFDASVEVSEVHLLDIEENGGKVVAFDGSGNQVKSVSIPPKGNNSFQKLTVDAEGVRRLEIRFVGSGAVAKIGFCPDGEEPPDEEPPAPTTGTGTIGYWKTHASAWPTDSLKIGSYTFPKSALLDVLGTPSKGNKAIDLAKQLVAAKLNVLAGNESSCIAETIELSDRWLSIFGYDVKGSHWGWTYYGASFHQQLDDYNNGRLCAPHRG